MAIRRCADSVSGYGGVMKVFWISLLVMLCCCSLLGLVILWQRPVVATEQVLVAQVTPTIPAVGLTPTLPLDRSLPSITPVPTKTTPIAATIVSVAVVTIVEPTQLPSPSLKPTVLPSVTLIPSSTPTPTITLTPTPTPTTIPTSKTFTTAGIQHFGKVTVQSETTSILLSFGDPEIASFLTDNRATISPPPLESSNNLWLNFKLQLQSTETIPVFDDPALVLLQGERVIFALSTAQFQSEVIQSQLISSWLPLSLRLTTQTPLTFYAGDNGDLINPTTADVILESVSLEPTYPGNFFTSTIRPQPTITTIDTDTDLLLVDNITWPLYLGNCFSCNQATTIQQTINLTTDIWWLAPDMLSQFGQLITPQIDQTLPLQLYLQPLDAWLEFELAS